MKNRLKINYKIVLGLLAFLLLLGFIWVLLLGRVNLILQESMEKQVAEQLEASARQLEEKLDIELKRLENVSRHISERLETTEEVGVVLSSVDSIIQDGDTGMLMLDGSAVYGRELLFSEFPAIKEAFHGNSSVCYKENEGFLFTVPVYKGNNIRYVIYSFYDIETFRQRYMVECYGESGKLLLAEYSSTAIVTLQEWSNTELEKLFDGTYQEGFSVVDKELYSLKAAAVLQKTDNEEMFLAVADVGQYGLYLVGLVEAKAVSTGLSTVSTLVFWVFGLMILLFTIGTVYLLSIEQKAKESDALREAKRAAEQASRAKSDFLANMSHEIRTPINAVMGMNEMVLRECESETIRGYALNIQSASQNLLGIINDILDFSKIESGKMEIVEANYHFGSLINDVVTMIQIKADESGLEFHLNMDETIPNVLYGDEGRIRQVMVNILNNAVKYTKQGSVTLDIRGRREENEVLLEIAVIDTGIGIKEEDMEKLFRDFERLDLKENRNVEGTGLGLAITRNLVEMMRGTLKVSSVYHQGSTFTACIPQRVVSEEPVGDCKQRFEEFKKQKSVYHESFVAKDARVLVVDDNEMNLQVVRNLLKKTQMQVTTCLSGDECLKLITATQYHIVLLDHMMPGMDGIETLRKAKELEHSRCKETPFVALTANAISGVREMYLEAGFDDYLSKPVTGKALEEMILKYLPKELVEQDRSDAVASEGVQNPKNSQEMQEEDKLNVKNGLLNVALGLMYSCDSKEMYQELLCMFVNSWEEKKSQIEENFRAENWKDYTTYVHGLKSSSLSVGAEVLSAHAKEHEMAGKAILREEEIEKNKRFIADNQKKLLDLYRDSVEEAKAYINS